MTLFHKLFREWRARAVNRWRKVFPHPADVTRRQESERGKKARARVADRDRQRALLFARGLERERESAHG